MIIFNTREEANNFKDWVNSNCPMLPILLEEPREEDGKWVFDSTEDLKHYYTKFGTI